MAPPWFGERLISGTPPQNKEHLSGEYLTDIFPSLGAIWRLPLPAITGSMGDYPTQGLMHTSVYDRGAGNFLYPCRLLDTFIRLCWRWDRGN